MDKMETKSITQVKKRSQKLPDKLDIFINLIYSENKTLQIEGVIGLRKLVSIDRNRK